MKYLIGLDNGGTFSKAAVFDENGTELASSSCPTEVITPKPGYTERDLEVLWEANCTVLKDAVEKSGVATGDIAGISFSGHGKGLYVVKADGSPAWNGILSTDARAWRQVKRWYDDGTNKKVYGKTYQEILACQPVSLLAWLKENEPEAYADTAYVFSVNDYVRFRLTGEAYAEYTNFSGGNLVNLETGAYDRELLELFGIGEVYDKLPPLKHASDVCGHVCREASLKTGLPEGIPCAAGMFDVDACGVATGLTDEEQLCMIAGTWSINEYIASRPVLNGTVALNSMFCMPGYFLVEESSPTSAGNMEWFINTLMGAEKNETSGSIYDVTNKWVESIEPQDSDVVFLPFLNGSNEHALAKGTFVGLTAYHNKKHMLRAVYEGIVFSHVTHVKKLLRNREAPKTVRLSGGAANSPVWVQIFADALQIPIETVDTKEQGAQGAAMAAGIAAGIYRDFREAADRTVKISGICYPRAEYKEIYEKKYARYRAVVDALDCVWDRFEN